MDDLTIFKITYYAGNDGTSLAVKTKEEAAAFFREKVADPDLRFIEVWETEEGVNAAQRIWMFAP